ncbi:MAG: Swt1 family HEPN domain-containing protein, partial [Desulfobaccales bacterium]
MIGKEMEQADISQILKDTENALRDFIAFILSQKNGPEWEANCGVSSERLRKWEERKDVEVKRQKTGAVDERLIYYADFYDLKTILKKHWEHFAPALGELKEMEAWLSALEKLRDPEAHRRELLPHQKSLIEGLSGEIRTKITRYRSRLETAEGYYPRIEFAADNLGNSWKPGEGNYIRTGLILKP